MDIRDNFREIANELSVHHGLFSMMWQLGRPEITDAVDTAAVGFDNTGACVKFMFNPDFMEKLDLHDACFVVAHECLHVILGHGKRLKGLYPSVANIAADITINEMLTGGFGFNPSPVIADTMCVRKSVFSPEKLPSIQANREFEYYYSKIMEDATIVELISSGEGMSPLDDHSQLPDNLPQEIKDMIEKMSQEEVKNLDQHLKPGDSDAYQWVKATLKPKPKEDWRKVIKNWTIKEFREKKKTQWKVLDRRFAAIQKTLPKVVIPSIGPIEEKLGARIDMTFFMDISGSCVHQSQKFFAAAKTIPQDKFIISAFAFNTGIIPVNISADKLPEGGGTAFHQLEEHCLKQKVYPSTVFVLTDGYGTDVKPKHPERWHIFLTEECRTNFPEGCNFYEFKDFHGNT